MAIYAIKSIAVCKSEEYFLALVWRIRWGSKVLPEQTRAEGAFAQNGRSPP
jgi:hypothetical protein